MEIDICVIRCANEIDITRKGLWFDAFASTLLGKRSFPYRLAAKYGATIPQYGATIPWVNNLCANEMGAKNCATNNNCYRNIFANNFNFLF